MEFSDVGKHCHYELCQQQTYLPFECEACHHHFCRFHRTQETHECPKLQLSSKNNADGNTSIIESKESDSKQDSISIGTAAKITTNNGTTTTTSVTKKPFKCKKKGCKKREWTEIKCEHCKRNYCIMHRNPDDHNCDDLIKKLMNDNKKGGNSGINDIGIKRQSLINTVLSTFTNGDNNNNNGVNNPPTNINKNPTIMVR